MERGAGSVAPDQGAVKSLILQSPREALLNEREFVLRGGGGAGGGQEGRWRQRRKGRNKTREKKSQFETCDSALML